jgi:hypothetical protein
MRGRSLRRRGLLVGVTFTALSGIAVGPSATMTLSSLGASESRSESQTARILTATADTVVRQDRPEENHGSERRLGAGRSPASRILLTFSVSGLPEITSAVLRMRATGDGGSENGGTVRSLTDTAWSERDVTWGTAPVDGRAVGAFGPVWDGTWHTVDVSSAVTGNGTYSFSITSDSDDDVAYTSRESTDPPQLVVFADTRQLAVAATSSPSSSPSSPTSSPSSPTSEAPSPSASPSPAGTTKPPRTGSSPSEEPRRRPTGHGRTAVLVGAGDIGSCERDGDEATTKLLKKIPGTIFAAGDVSQDEGTPEQFRECVDETWGQLKDRIRPAPGNHDYGVKDASGYFDYFGKAAGEPGKGYYSYDVGEWHVVSLNSNCDDVSCAKGSQQERWLRSDLAANDRPCTAAYWHHPLFTSSDHEPTTEVRPLFRALYDHGVEIVMNGHNHVYERFAPQDPDGNRDEAKGVRQFSVGTGGGGAHYGFGDIQANSQVRNGETYGVLRLTLKPAGYDWKFIPVSGESFTDSGSAECH